MSKTAQPTIGRIPRRRSCALRYASALLVSAFIVTTCRAAETSTRRTDYRPDAIPLSQSKKVSWSGRAADQYYLAIYSGSTTGVYFSVAGTICDLMRKTYDRHHIRCVPLRSGGTGSNIQLMNAGRAQVAMIQSDKNWEASQSILPIPDARSIMSLHNETGVIVARADAGIRSIADLRGKRINIGPENSATRQMWLSLLAANGMDKNDFRKVYGVAQDFNQPGLCQDYIDAYGIWIGHPSRLISDNLAACKTHLIGMNGTETDRFVAEKAYLFKDTLPAGTYPGQKQPIDSYGIKASLIAASGANPYVIYWLTRIVHEHVTTLRHIHPVLRGLDPDEMRDKGNFVAFHQGAACYWHGDEELCAWQKEYPVFVSPPDK